MQTVTVATKEEFENAVNNNVEKIIITGDLAKKIISQQKKKNIGKKVGIGGAIAAGAAVVAGIALAPATGGASAAVGLTAAATMSAGTITLTTAEFIAFCGTVLGALGIAADIINTVAKNYNVTVNAGSTTVECIRK